MNTIKSAYVLVILAFIACTDTPTNLKNAFAIDTSNLKQVYTLSENISLKIKENSDNKIDSVHYTINKRKIATVLGNTPVVSELKKCKLGYQKIEATVFSKGKKTTVTTSFTIASSIPPKLLKYKIVTTYPHDIKAYTQGFEFYRDTLYEGTGNGAGYGTGKRGLSSLRKTDYKTGKVIKKITLAPIYFGEGITILNNKIYQLTWKHNKGFVYNADTFEKLKTFDYFKKMEGWGLTNDGKILYMSDGTEKIYFLNPETLKEINHINVYTQNSKIELLNELEWIDNKIWANIYTKDALAVIRPETGEVEAVLNLSELKDKVTPHPDLDYLNGIAYNPKTKTIFITGKNWDKTFEITILPEEKDK